MMMQTDSFPFARKVRREKYVMLGYDNNEFATNNNKIRSLQ